MLLAVLIAKEARTSAWQARWFAAWAAEMSYGVADGRSPAIAFPADGPFNRRRGYNAIPGLVERLEQRGYEVTEQARFSPELLQYTQEGYTPPVRFPMRAGLRLRGTSGTVLYEPPRETVFESFAAVPPLARAAVLFVENRELLDPGDPRKNPAIEWDRIFLAGGYRALGSLGLDTSRAGGSTLATQIEKYRHSARGRTESVTGKLRQMVAASLRAYRDGPDTRNARREILVDYLNSMPLSAAPGYGEVHGLGEGLRAWFGLDFDATRAALSNPASPGQAKAFRHVLALVCAVREPTRMLVTDRTGLDARVDSFVRLMARNDVISNDFAEQVLRERTTFGGLPPISALSAPAHRKPVDATRRDLLGLLDAGDFYGLDRMHLDVGTTLDADLQARVWDLLMSLRDPRVAARHGLQGRRMLGKGSNDDVIYSFLLYERTEAGPLLRVQADTSSGAFDLNEDMKLELGSTAKLRTLVHYLEVVSLLHAELSAVSPADRRQAARKRGDRLTQWVAAELAGRTEGMTENEILLAALERTYSASPGESFFTGGGVHRFGNFEDRDDAKVLSVREATWRSTNLVFIRLMRDLTLYHRARLPYDADGVLKDPASPERARLLSRVAEQESQQALARAYFRFRGVPRDELPEKLLGAKARSLRHLAILHAAWQPSITEESLAAWLERHGTPAARPQAPRLLKAYGRPALTLADFAYLLARRPLDVWVAGELHRAPGASLEALRGVSAEPRRVAWAWLFESRNRSAQDRRLKILAEQDAFLAMTPYWQRLGFPFELVPSLATSIGSSADRPAALAALVRTVQAGGVWTGPRRMAALRLAEGTPYETALRAGIIDGERVLTRAVAKAVRQVMVGVVEEGTARRLAGAFVLPDGTVVPAGGKTGSGDNRSGRRVVNRTATFVFFIGDRYHGAMTAYVAGSDAAQHSFTSGLVVSILKLVAPAIVERLAEPAKQWVRTPRSGA